MCVGVDDMDLCLLIGSPWIGWSQVKMGKREGKIMIAVGICLTATWVIMLLVGYGTRELACLWILVTCGLAFVGSALIRKGWKHYKQG